MLLFKRKGNEIYGTGREEISIRLRVRGDEAAGVVASCSDGTLIAAEHEEGRIITTHGSI